MRNYADLIFCYFGMPVSTCQMFLYLQFMLHNNNVNSRGNRNSVSNEISKCCIKNSVPQCFSSPSHDFKVPEQILNLYNDNQDRSYLLFKYWNRLFHIKIFKTRAWLVPFFDNVMYFYSMELMTCTDLFLERFHYKSIKMIKRWERQQNKISQSSSLSKTSLHLFLPPFHPEKLQSVLPYNYLLS